MVFYIYLVEPNLLTLLRYYMVSHRKQTVTQLKTSLVDGKAWKDGKDRPNLTDELLYSDSTHDGSCQMRHMGQAIL